jgi:hypothetical protein
MSYPEGVNRRVNRQPLGKQKTNHYYPVRQILDFYFPMKNYLAVDKIPKVLALAAACVRLLTPSFP